MIDQTHINLLDLIPTTMKRVSSTNGGEYHGACPWCGGNDRFIVQPERGFWFCRRCDRRGDPITFVREYENLSFREALEYLNIESEKKPQRQRQPAGTGPVAPRVLPDDRDDIDYIHWRKRARAFTEYATDQLHKPQHQHIVEYLTVERRLSESIIDVLEIGYNPAPINDIWGGVPVYLPQGITIPATVEPFGDVVRIKIRTGGNPKYIQPAGSQPYIYGGWRIKLNTTVILTESEFDVVSLYSYFGMRSLVAVATGSTTHCRYQYWLARLAIAARVLVAFDRDHAGMNANQYWLQHLPNAVELIPTRKDINEMLVAGDDLRHWITGALGVNHG